MEDQQRASTGRSLSVHNTISTNPLKRIVIRTLGGLKVTRHYDNGETVEIPSAAWRHGRALSVVSYLLSRPGFTSSRAALRDAIWPRGNPQVTNTYVSNGLWNLRVALGVERHEPAFLHITDTTVRLNMARGAAAGTVVDFVEFEAQTQRLRGVGEPGERLGAALDALALFQGEFLPECAGHLWSFGVRERLRERWASAMVIAAKTSVELSRVDEALELADGVLAVLPDHEDAAELALRLLVEQRRRREARALYERIWAYFRSAYHSEPPLSLQLVAGPAARHATAPLNRQR